MGIIPAIPEWVGWVLFAVSTLLATNAGKGLAAKKHDADLAKKYGKQLSMFGLALYVYAILSIAFSLFSTLATKAFSVSLKLMFAGLSLMPVLTGVVYPLLVMGVSYAVFHTRYSKVNEPLTREGKLAIRIVEKEIGFRERIEKIAKTSSPLQLADKAVRGVKEMAEIFAEEDRKEKS